MKGTGGGKTSARNYGLQRLLIFLFFTTGSVLSQLISSVTYLPENVQPVLLICAFTFGIVLILSASVLGIALLPMCAFAFGWLFGEYAEIAVESFKFGAGLDVKGLMLSAVVVPIFFIVSVRGMYTSEMLGSMLDNCNASARAEYNKAYIPIAAAAVAGMLAVYFILS